MKLFSRWRKSPPLCDITEADKVAKAVYGENSREYKKWRNHLFREATIRKIIRFCMYWLFCAAYAFSVVLLASLIFFSSYIVVLGLLELVRN